MSLHFICISCLHLLQVMAFFLWTRFEQMAHILLSLWKMFSQELGSDSRLIFSMIR